MEQPFSRIQEQVSLIKEKDDSKGSTGTDSDAEAAQILAENRRLMREQKEEQLRLQREEEEKLRKEKEMRLAEEARLIRLQEEKKLGEEKKIKDEEDALLAEEERLKMVEKVRQERERVMQQNQQECRERKNQIPKRKKGKLPSDFTPPPPEETMLHKGKQNHRAEWRHMEESKMAKINKCRRNEPRCHNGSTVIALGYKFVHASMFLQEPKGTGCYFLCPFLPCHILKFD
ncbi:Reticulocyte-binding protein 2 like a [Dissostichus eleginoides]|uniref:Reticulocyte-binding protein 2 like a n=1 Tax=Dissostichus eleginoides TaxID=100907 RepID=A0AAD9C8K1_DISEL|nr:Reticulocyte-binding protein 2 like a [Dissostichus eleginoides]